MHIPLVDLTEQYGVIREEIQAAMQAVLEGQQFILGPEVEALEAELARYCGAAHAVGVSSGTDALLAALMTLGVGPGDEIVTTPFTFFASAGVISRLGARAVFADIAPDTFLLDPEKAEGVITPKTKAIIPVHLYGLCQDMIPFLEMVAERKIHVVEDTAQALGARRDGQFAGTKGLMGCLSFFPTKNLGAFGDGGMVLTSSEERAAHLRRLRVHGGSKQYLHEEIGGNFRLDTLQAAVLRVKLKYLEEWNRKRRENAQRYDSYFEDANLVGEPVVTPGNFDETHVFHQYVIRVRDRDNLRKFLLEKGVSTGVYYPVPLHLQPCFRSLGYKKGDFPEAERASEEVLALPVYPELRREQQEYVVEGIRDFYRNS